MENDRIGRSGDAYEVMPLFVAESVRNWSSMSSVGLKGSCVWMWVWMFLCLVVCASPSVVRRATLRPIFCLGAPRLEPTQETCMIDMTPNTTIVLVRKTRSKRASNDVMAWSKNPRCFSPMVVGLRTPDSLNCEFIRSSKGECGRWIPRQETLAPTSATLQR